MAALGKMVALQTFCEHRKIWQTYGEYKSGGKPLRRALNELRPQYHHLHIQVVPIKEGRILDAQSSIAVSGKSVAYPIPTDDQLRAVRELVTELTAETATVQERVQAQGILQLIKLSEFVRAEAFILKNKYEGEI